MELLIEVFIAWLMMGRANSSNTTAKASSSNITKCKIVFETLKQDKVQMFERVQLPVLKHYGRCLTYPLLPSLKIVDLVLRLIK